MQFYTYKVLGTEMSPFRWNGSYIPIEVLYFISLPLSQKFEEQLNWRGKDIDSQQRTFDTDSIAKPISMKINTGAERYVKWQISLD